MKAEDRRKMIREIAEISDLSLAELSLALAEVREVVGRFPEIEYSIRLVATEIQRRKESQ